MDNNYLKTLIYIKICHSRQISNYEFIQVKDTTSMGLFDDMNTLTVRDDEKSIS
jgi:hypothetical protein